MSVCMPKPPMETNPMLANGARTDSLPTNSARNLKLRSGSRSAGRVVRIGNLSKTGVAGMVNLLGRHGDCGAAVVLTDGDDHELGRRRESDAALDVDLSLLDHVRCVDGCVAGDVEGFGDRRPLEPAALPERAEVARA